MATVTKTWTFAADNEGLADVGDSAISLAHDTAGNPGGSLEFLGAASGTTERARRATTGQTWETWGVPAGSTVTDVQVTGWDSRKWANTGTPTVKVRVVGSGGGTVHSAGDLVSLALGAGANVAWVANGAGTSRAVDSGSQPSTTDVRLEIQIDLTAAQSGFDLGLDNIALLITYTAGGPTAVSATRALSYDIRNTVAATRVLSYDVRNTVSGSRALAYDLLNTVAATRALAYDVIAFLAASRQLSYDVLAAAGAVSAQRALFYDLLNGVLTTRVVSYDVLAQIAAVRAVSYDMAGFVAGQRALVYDLGDVVIPPGASRQSLLWLS